MTENELTPATREKEFIDYIPEFGLDFPNSNPLIARSTITLRQEGDELRWRLKYRVSSGTDCAPMGRNRRKSFVIHFS